MNLEQSIFWFRRDLRLDDNHGLYEALMASHSVIPIFIFDTAILSELPENDARITFIYDTLSKLKEKLNGKLALYFGDPVEIFSELTSSHNITAVFTNHDYEPYALQRDKDVSEVLNSKNISFKSFKDQVIFETNEVVKKDGTAYLVYTPYMKKWRSLFDVNDLTQYPSEKHLDNCSDNFDFPHLSLKDIGFTRSDQAVAAYDHSEKLIQNYEAVRNFPAVDGTSRIGPHLRFGTLSIRDLVIKASQQSNPIFLQELIWREFFMQILWHFPHTVNQSFKPKYDRIQWRNNETEFQLWCEGKTGFPLVDAGMRQLNQTGFMHNRVRMLVGSFLCKHLLIDWRWGEAYFAEKLHDYELASNVGNWQWVAGCGVDAAPYFRIFNPTTQIKKFDKDLEYIKTWVTDFQEFSYPEPMVDHKEARERCLRVYKEALS